MDYSYILTMMQNAVKNYHGGITSVALTMQKSPNILANKLNPNTKSHVLGFEEAAQIIKIIQSREIVDALASLVNATIIDFPKQKDIHNKNLKLLLEEFIFINKRCAILGEKIIQAYTENSPGGTAVTVGEAKEIRSELNRLINNAVRIKFILDERIGEKTSAESI